jgi:hypothetical protein
MGSAERGGGRAASAGAETMTLRLESEDDLFDHCLERQARRDSRRVIGNMKVIDPMLRELFGR